MARRRSGSRSRSRGGKGSRRQALVRRAAVLVAVSVVLASVVHSGAITNVFAPRDADTDVVDDPSGLIGVNTTGPGDGATERLTELTNNFNQTADLTVQLTGSSADWGSLFVNGVDYGDSATFDDVGAGSTKSVDIALTCSDAIVGEDVTYTVDVSDAGITGTLDTRRATIEKRCLTWYTASDWDNVSREHGVVHEGFGDHDAADVELGYNTSDANLTAYWPLDEDSGSTATDATGNGHDGTITGATLGQTGILGTSAYDFDGSDDYVNISSSSELQGGTDATVSAVAWFNPDTESPVDRTGIVGKQLDGSDGDWGIIYRDSCPSWDGDCQGYPELNTFTDNGVWEGGSSTYNYTHSHNAGSNQITLVAVLWEGPDTGENEVSSVTYGGNSLTEGVDTSFESGGYEANVEIWYILDADMPAAGSHTVEVNHPSSTDSGDRWRSFAYTFDEVNQSAPFDTATAGNSNSASISTSVSSSTNEDVLVTAIADGDGVSYSWDHAESEQADVGSGTFGATTAWKRTTNGPGSVSTGATAGTEPNRHALATLTLEPATPPPYVGYYSEDGGNDYGLFAGGISSGTWYHVGFVLDQPNNNLDLYLNGTKVMSDSSTGQISASTTQDVEIGATTYSSDYFDGRIDEVRVYNRTLSDKEVAVLANGSDPNNGSAVFNGTHVTGWETTDSTLDAGNLRLSDVVADVSGGAATVYVESDPNGDGTVNETSAGIGLNGSTGPYDVTGLTTDSDRFRLRVEMSTTNITETPCFSGATLSQVGGLPNGSRDGCGMTDATANKKPTADFTYTDTSANWYNDSWNNRKEITINHTRVASDLSDFPVLVNLSDSDLAADAQDDGDDILFATENGSTKLDHEIEEFNGSSGDLAAWVEVPQVNSTSPDTTIYMYYNNSGAGNQENASGVWDSNYVAVWHFDEEGAGTVRSDSTSFDNAATPQNFDGDENDAGRISDAAHLDGSGDHLNASDSASLEMSDGDNVTVEAWVNKDTAQSGWIAMVQKSDQSYNLQFDGGDDPEFTIYDGGWQTAYSGMTVNTGQWYHLVGTFDNSTGTIRIYVNGTEMGTGSASYISDASGWDVGIGENLDATGRHLDGLMDEVRISDTARPAAWIETAYNTTNDPSSFHSIGTEETKGVVSLDASDSSDPDGTVETYKWDFDDDGVYEETTTSATTTHEFAPGDHPVTLQVIDDDSATDNVTKTVTFLTNGPTAKFTYDEAWSKRKAITIDHTEVASDLSDYPVLINLTDSDLADKAQDDGDDILFTNASGVQLDHEIESFDGSTGELVAWVKVPSVSASSDTTLYMYYNNSGAANQENVSGVWDSDHAMVQHLEESPDSDGGTEEILDSTANANHGSANGSMGSSDQVSGKVGGAISFDGTDDNVTVPGHVTESGTITLSAWARTSGSISDDKEVVSIGDYAAIRGWSLAWRTIEEGNAIGFYYDGSDWPNTDTNRKLNDTAWHHVVYVINSTGDVQRTYVDGTLTNTSSFTADIAFDGSLGPDTLIGSHGDGGGRHWQGELDEVRVSSTDRSTGWIETAYNNTNDPSGFYSVGSETDTVAASFDASNSSDPDGTVSTYKWDWDGDGGYETTARTPRAVHDFGAAGDYDVTLEVVDDQGATNSTTKTVSVGNLEPTAAFTATSWTSRKALTIDHTEVASDLSGFPVLVDVTDRDLEYEAQSDGDDILFTESDGETKLAHEIEKFNGSNGHLVAWVRVPNVSSTANTTIYMYYNNSGASNQENVSGVWESDYAIVQHLEETSGTTVSDSTANDNDGTNNGAAQGVSGKVGDAYDFETDNSDYINVTTSPSLNVSYVHYSAWVKAETFVDNMGVMAKGDDTNRQYWIWHFNETIHYEVDETVYKSDYPKLSTSTWYKLDIVYNGSTTRAYLNGSLQASHSQSTGTVLSDDDGFDTGRLPGWDQWDGVIDEARVKDGTAGNVSSAAWVNASFVNQNDPSGFVTVGSEENATLARFDASNSSDPDGSTSTYEWDFTDDGTYEESSSNATTLHRYSSTGTYDVTLRVTDDGGRTNNTTKSVTVAGEAPNEDPTADFTYTQVGDDWYDTAWENRKEITIDHTQVASDLSNFPVLVNLSDSDLAADAQNDGDDILFTTGNGTTKLDHEIEFFDGSTGDLVAWVGVPEINSTSPDTSIYVYYNNSGAGNQENASGVWDSNYKGVWHLDGTSGDANDSTSYGNDGTVVDVAARGQDGIVGDAHDFEADNNHGIEVPDDASLDITSQVTLSAWIKPETVDNWKRIVAKSHTTNDYPYTLYGLLYDDADHLRIEIASCTTTGDSSCQNDVNGATTVPTTSWTYATVTYDGSTMRVYFNGTQDASESLSTTIPTNDVNLTIGKSEFEDDYFDGLIDEARVSDTARSAAWIETTYNNTADPSGFVTVGGEESGVSVDFDASGSSDPDGVIDTYEWDWDDDGVYEASTSSATTTHAFDPGSHNVTLRVVDDEDATNSTTKTVTV